MLRALTGTRTEESLKKAFDMEAGTYARNTIYANEASKVGDISAGNALREQAANDRAAAELWLSYLDEIGDTLENLKEMSARKDSGLEDFYEALAEIADEEGFSEIAEKFRMSKRVKTNHGNMLREEMDRFESGLYDNNADTAWRCSVCGYEVRGNTPPEYCPLCGFPRDFFRKAN